MDNTQWLTTLTVATAKTHDLTISMRPWFRANVKRSSPWNRDLHLCMMLKMWSNRTLHCWKPPQILVEGLQELLIFRRTWIARKPQIDRICYFHRESFLYFQNPKWQIFSFWIYLSVKAECNLKVRNSPFMLPRCLKWVLSRCDKEIVNMWNMEVDWERNVKSGC